MDLAGGGDGVRVGGLGGRLGGTSPTRLLLDDLATELDAFVADVDGTGPGNQPPHLVPALSAEGAVVLGALRPVAGHGQEPPLLATMSLCSSTSSTKP